jgi:hypothetical protein
VQRMAGLGLEIIHLRLVTPPLASPAAPRSGYAQDAQGS